MTFDFRANQFRGNKLIASGSTGTNASLLIYDIAADDIVNPNQGLINPSNFSVTGIGTDVFLFVSGAIDSKNVADSHGLTLFGGDTHTSGSIYIDRNRSIKVADLPLGSPNPFAPRPNLTIQAANVIAGGSGGHLELFSGGGGTSDGFQGHDGGNTRVRGGVGGDTDLVGRGGNGGNVELTAGVGGSSIEGNAGAGGNIFISAGWGGDALGNGFANDGGNVLITLGRAGDVTRRAGNFTLAGGDTVDRKNLVDVGSLVQIGVTPSSRVKRFFINQDASENSLSFPGSDIFFFVSGAINTNDPDNQAKSVFGGDVLVSGSLSSKITKTFIHAASYASTNATSSNPAIVGQIFFNVNEVQNKTINFRTVLSTTNGSAMATLQLFNLTSGSFVHIGGPNILALSSSSTTPNMLQSVNLMTAANFNLTSSVYEVRVHTQTGTQSAIHGGSQMVCGG